MLDPDTYHNLKEFYQVGSLYGLKKDLAALDEEGAPHVNIIACEPDSWVSYEEIDFGHDYGYYSKVHIIGQEPFMVVATWEPIVGKRLAGSPSAESCGMTVLCGHKKLLIPETIVSPHYMLTAFKKLV